MRPGCLLLCVVMLTACSKSPRHVTTKEHADPPAIAEKKAEKNRAEPVPPDIAAMKAVAVTGEGINVYDRETETTRVIRFGLRRSAMLEQLTFLGKPETNPLDKCRGGPFNAATWPKGLTLFFKGERWVGWAAGPRRDHLDKYAGVVTTQGVGPGSLQEEAAVWLRADFFDSPLGLEFKAGNISGLVDGIGEGALVTDMWAGVVCRVDDEPPSRAIDSATRLNR